MCVQLARKKFYTHISFFIFFLLEAYSRSSASGMRICPVAQASELFVWRPEGRGAAAGEEDVLLPLSTEPLGDPVEPDDADWVLQLLPVNQSI